MPLADRNQGLSPPRPDLAPRTVRLLAALFDAVLNLAAPLLALASGLAGTFGAAKVLQRDPTGLLARIGAGIRGGTGLAIAGLALVAWLVLVI